jgi:hypothetical protein
LLAHCMQCSVPGPTAFAVSQHCTPISPAQAAALRHPAGRVRDLEARVQGLERQLAVATGTRAVAAAGSRGQQPAPTRGGHARPQDGAHSNAARAGRSAATAASLAERATSSMAVRCRRQQQRTTSAATDGRDGSTEAGSLGLASAEGGGQAGLQGAECGGGGGGRACQWSSSGGGPARSGGGPCGAPHKLAAAHRDAAALRALLDRGVRQLAAGDKRETGLGAVRGVTDAARGCGGP